MPDVGLASLGSGQLYGTVRFKGGASVADRSRGQTTAKKWRARDLRICLSLLQISRFRIWCIERTRETSE